LMSWWFMISDNWYTVYNIYIYLVSHSTLLFPRYQIVSYYIPLYYIIPDPSGCHVSNASLPDSSDAGASDNFAERAWLWRWTLWCRQLRAADNSQAPSGDGLKSYIFQWKNLYVYLFHGKMWISSRKLGIDGMDRDFIKQYFHRHPGLGAPVLTSIP
jgi:hypothetical protein